MKTCTCKCGLWCVGFCVWNSTFLQISFNKRVQKFYRVREVTVKYSWNDPFIGNVCRLVTFTTSLTFSRLYFCSCRMFCMMNLCFIWTGSSAGVSVGAVQQWQSCRPLGLLWRSGATRRTGTCRAAVRAQHHP